VVSGGSAMLSVLDAIAQALAKREQEKVATSARAYVAAKHS
jgi:hypothetical protein